MKTFDDKKGVFVDVPTGCDICGQFVGPAYDVHMAIAHPETRPKPEQQPEQEKKKTRNK